MSRDKLYFLWGLLLGCGLATETAYPAILVLIGVQATSGPVFAAILGGVFGVSRGAIALALSFMKLDPVGMMDTLPRFAGSAARLNMIVTVLGSSALTAASF